MKRSRERNVDSRIHLQLEEDGGGSTRQSWMETSDLWTYVTLGATRHTSNKSKVHLVTAVFLQVWCPSGHRTNRIKATHNDWISSVTLILKISSHSVSSRDWLKSLHTFLYDEGTLSDTLFELYRSQSVTYINCHHQTFWIRSFYMLPNQQHQSKYIDRVNKLHTCWVIK